MGRFLEDAACAALGYGVASLVNSKKKTRPDAIKNAIEANDHIPLSCIVADYARVHNIYGRDNNFYRQLLEIAEQYHDPYND